MSDSFDTIHSMTDVEDTKDKQLTIRFTRAELRMYRKIAKEMYEDLDLIDGPTMPDFIRFSINYWLYYYFRARQAFEKKRAALLRTQQALEAQKPMNRLRAISDEMDGLNARVDQMDDESDDEDNEEGGGGEYFG